MYIWFIKIDLGLMNSNVCFSSYENEELAPVDAFKWREFVVGIKFRTSVTVIEMAVTR